MPVALPIPSVDHQTPPGVSLEQYRVYLRLLDEYIQPAAWEAFQQHHHRT